ncbi:MAG TPA: hypothetical protein VJ775_02065 [Sphingomicrobium sp.]|nr:hypothetical protein [Sphingomicrobium sp.]
MALKELAAALTLLAAASPLSATVQEPGTPAGAPAGNPDTLYCMHIEAITGSRLEEVKCWTRAEWADRGVDVDKDWAREGVSVIG